MSSTWTTFVFEMVNFLILTAVLGWLLFRPVREALARRHTVLAQEAEGAARKRAEAERLQEDMQQRFATLHTELDRMRHDTLAQAQQEAEQIRAEARATAEREREVTRNRLAHLEETQLERLATAVATATSMVIERLLRQIGGPDLDRRLAQSACCALQELKGVALGAVMVESAQPLDQGTRAELAAALGEATRTTEFRVNETLGAGLRISTNHGLIDASAAGLAAFARSALTEQLSTLPHGQHAVYVSAPEEPLHHV